jgi:hypothetical protein
MMRGLLPTTGVQQQCGLGRRANDFSWPHFGQRNVTIGSRSLSPNFSHLKKLGSGAPFTHEDCSLASFP